MNILGNCILSMCCHFDIRYYAYGSFQMFVTCWKHTFYKRSEVCMKFNFIHIN